jgi:hypothetical protein
MSLMLNSLLPEFFNFNEKRVHLLLLSYYKTNTFVVCVIYVI